MSNYNKGTVIQLENKGPKYVVLSNLEKEDKELLLVLPVDEIKGKWEDIQSADELKAHYDKVMVLAHETDTDNYYFEEDINTISEVLDTIF